MIWLFYFLVFFLPFQNHYVVNATIGSYTIFKLLGLLLFFLALGRAFTKGMPNVLGSLPAKAMLFFVFWRVLSWLFAEGYVADLTSGTSYGIANAISAVFFLFVTLALVDDREKLRRTILVIAAGMVLAGLYIVRDYLGGDDRPGWPFQDANYYALYGMTVLPLALALLGTEKGKLVRWGCYAGIALTVIGVIVSASRAGFITLLLFGLIQIIRGKNARQKIALLAALLVCSIFTAPKAIQRLTHPTESDIASNDAHRAFSKAAFQIMIEHPLLGVGPASTHFKVYLPDLRFEVFGIAHNTFLQMGAESGLPALLAYLCLVGSSFFLLGRKAREFNRRKEIFLENLSRGLQLSLLNSSLVGLTVSASHVRFLWFTFILVILLNQRRLIPVLRGEVATTALPTGMIPQPFSPHRAQALTSAAGSRKSALGRHPVSPKGGWRARCLQDSGGTVPPR